MISSCSGTRTGSVSAYRRILNKGPAEFKEEVNPNESAQASASFPVASLGGRSGVWVSRALIGRASAAQSQTKAQPGSQSQTKAQPAKTDNDITRREPRNFHQYL